MNTAKKYQRCMVLSGGGFRFGYYLGMYAAMVQANRAPDILLASCGGAIAAAIIQALPEDTQRKAWVSSEAMFQFWREMRSNPHARLSATLLNAVKRRFNSHAAPLIPDLFDDYLFEIDRYFPLPEHTKESADISVAIVAAKLLYSKIEVGSPRGAKKLFQEVVFCDKRSRALLHGMPSAISSETYSDNAIATRLGIDTTMPVNEATRASISDMFYFQCLSYQGNNYTGGAINLLPIEIARNLANEVIMEIKSPYDQSFSVPAIRAVFGFDANQRLREVAKQGADIWVDTSDMQVALKHHRIQKRIRLASNRIDLVPPSSYPAYVEMMDAQWQYGYARGLNAIQHSANNQQ